MKTRKIVTISILTSLGIVLSIIESFIPSFVPGAKLGLANIITLIIIYIYSYKEAILSLFIRIFIVGLLYSGLFSVAFILSLSGGILSMIFIILIHKLTKDLFFTSLCGSLFHQVGQILSLMFLINSVEVLYYLPIMILISIPAGIVTALIASIVLKSFKYEIGKIKKIPLTCFILIFIISLSFVLYFNFYKVNDNQYAVISYNGDTILKIDLDNPKLINESNYNDIIKDSYTSGDSIIYVISVMNKDDDKYHDMIIEVKNKEIRIKESSCEKRVCSHQGFISNKFERIICVPNGVIISIEENNGDIDFIM